MLGKLSLKQKKPRSEGYSKRELRAAFDLFDVSKTGKISDIQMMKILHSLGYSDSAAEIQSRVAELDKNGNGHIDFDEFVDMMAEHRQNMDAVAELTQTFQVFDRDRNGVISLEELKAVMGTLVEGISDEDVEVMMANADLNKDGNIDFDEFKAIMQMIKNM